MAIEDWEIRAIKPRSTWWMNHCTAHGGLCHEVATHYLILKPQSSPMRSAESRLRRCEACARREAKEMGLTFPDPPTEPQPQ